MEQAAPWIILLIYCALTWWATPRRVSALQFFDGRHNNGQLPGIWLVALSAGITWIFAKSISNSASLANAYGLLGNTGYTIYYLSFAVAGIAIYFMRTRGGVRSLPEFLVDKYGGLCARLFLVAIAFRLFNEVWSNTKVMALYFGAEGSSKYWMAALLITLFTVAYAWRGGMRASLLTDRIQTIFVFVLLAIVLAVLMPGLQQQGLAPMDDKTFSAGLTFCGLALVQIMSYPFHDPVMTDRGFINRPDQMLRSFLLAGALSGGFIFLFGFIGLYARALGIASDPSLAVPASFGLLMMLVFNGIMLLSGGSTIDSTFTSVAKFAARDWPDRRDDVVAQHLSYGRIAIVVVAIAGNLPLLSIYLGDKIGPAIIAATTISGTMVMGLAPIFLLAWLRPAGAASFHLAFWPGLILGVVRAAETFLRIEILPSWLALGSGKFAIDLGVNVWGLLICTLGFTFGAVLAPRRDAAFAASMR